MERSYYDILEVPVHASAAEIKRAFRRLALLYHPDTNKNIGGHSLFFLEIKEAYETLIDPVKRQAYDRRKPYQEPVAGFVFSFYALADKTLVACFDELRVSFTYTGEGRFFKKPDFKYFFITGVPYVSVRKVMQAGVEVKETTLTYIICPMQTGSLVIDRAAVKIRNQSYFTEPLTIQVTSSRCFFSKDKPADGIPYKYPMFYEAAVGADKIRLLKNFSHTVLIPRSAYVQFYHRMAKGIKLVMMCWGVVICLMIKKNLAIGALTGLAFGGLMGNLLYMIAGVKPVFRLASRFKTVADYHAKGYQTGTDSGSRFLKSKWFYDLERLLF